MDREYKKIYYLESVTNETELLKTAFQLHVKQVL